MQWALEMRGLNHYKVSEDAGFNRNYLYESFHPDRHKGSLDGYKKIAEAVGMSYHWLLEEEGKPFKDQTIVSLAKTIEEQVDILLELFLEFQSSDKDHRILRLKLEIAILEFLQKEKLKM